MQPADQEDNKQECEDDKEKTNNPHPPLCGGEPSNQKKDDQNDDTNDRKNTKCRRHCSYVSLYQNSPKNVSKETSLIVLERKNLSSNKKLSIKSLFFSQLPLLVISIVVLHCLGFIARLDDIMDTPTDVLPENEKAHLHSHFRLQRNTVIEQLFLSSLPTLQDYFVIWNRSHAGYIDVLPGESDLAGKISFSFSQIWSKVGEWYINKEEVQQTIDIAKPPILDSYEVRKNPRILFEALRDYFENLTTPKFTTQEEYFYAISIYSRMYSITPTNLMIAIEKFFRKNSCQADMETFMRVLIEENGLFDYIISVDSWNNNDKISDAIIISLLKTINKMIGADESNDKISVFEHGTIYAKHSRQDPLVVLFDAYIGILGRRALMCGDDHLVEIFMRCGWSLPLEEILFFVDKMSCFSDDVVTAECLFEILFPNSKEVRSKIFDAIIATRNLTVLRTLIFYDLRCDLKEKIKNSEDEKILALLD